MQWLPLVLGFIAGLAFGAGLILLLVWRVERRVRAVAGSELYDKICREMQRKERP